MYFCVLALKKVVDIFGHRLLMLIIFVIRLVHYFIWNSNFGMVYIFSGAIPRILYFQECTIYNLFETYFQSFLITNSLKNRCLFRKFYLYYIANSLSFWSNNGWKSLHSVVSSFCWHVVHNEWVWLNFFLLNKHTKILNKFHIIIQSISTFTLQKIYLRNV